DASIVDAGGIVTLEPRHRLDRAIGHDDVGRPRSTRGWVDEPDSAQIEIDPFADAGARLREALGGHAGTARIPPADAPGDNPAIRIGTPIAAWSVARECGPLATSEAISTPSFIGPGCMTRQPAAALLSRSRVSPYRDVYSPRDGSSPDAIRSFWMRCAIT